MHLKEIEKNATCAWSPFLRQSPMLVAGTVSGAMDATFNSEAELGVYDLSVQSAGVNAVLLASISAPSRFNRLAWSPFVDAPYGSSEGIIIGGMEDGSLGFWHAGKLVANEPDPLISLVAGHKGPVRGLQVSPFQPFLVASGSVDGEVCLWDLRDLSKPYPPSSSKSQQLEDVTDIAWNLKVPHILAAASSNGYTVVWDLKNRKEILQLTAGRYSISSIAWNPDNPTQLLAASDDSGLIYSWDLRNARAPEKTLSSHTKGVLSIAWCPKDAEMLISTGKDCRAVFWNPSTAEVVGELPPKTNWTFEVQWCPKNPDLFYTAGFDGRVEVYSLQSLSASLSTSSAAAGIPVRSAVDEVFGQQAASMAHPHAMAAASSVKQVPKWLRRPVGATFGFGGRLAAFSARRPSKIAVTSVRPAARLLEHTSRLEMATAGKMQADYCVGKASSSSAEDAFLWRTLAALFDGQPKRRLVESVLGIDAASIRLERLSLTSPTAAEVTKTTRSPTAAEVTKTRSPVDDAFDGVNGSEFDFAEAIRSSPSHHTTVTTTTKTASSHEQQPELRRQSTFEAIPFSLYSAESDEYDRGITKAIVLGEYKLAVDLCVRAGRLPDALLVAICGGDALVNETRRLYLQHNSRHAYLRLVSSIVKHDLHDVVECASLEDWREVLALLCTSSDPALFSSHACLLAERLEYSPRQSFRMSAVVCYLVGGDAVRAAELVLDMLDRERPSRSDHAAHAAWLEGAIERLRMIEMATGQPLAPASPRIAAVHAEWSAVLASQGMLDQAAAYLAPTIQQSATDPQSRLFAERLFHAIPDPRTAFHGQQPPPAFPITDLPIAKPLQQSHQSHQLQHPGQQPHQLQQSHQPHQLQYPGQQPQQPGMHQYAQQQAAAGPLSFGMPQARLARPPPPSGEQQPRGPTLPSMQTVRPPFPGAPLATSASQQQQQPIIATPGRPSTPAIPLPRPPMAPSMSGFGQPPMQPGGASVGFARPQVPGGMPLGGFSGPPPTSPQMASQMSAQPYQGMPPAQRPLVPVPPGAARVSPSSGEDFAQHQMAQQRQQPFGSRSSFSSMPDTQQPQSPTMPAIPRPAMPPSLPMQVRPPVLRPPSMQTASSPTNLAPAGSIVSPPPTATHRPPPSMAPRPFAQQPFSMQGQPQPPTMPPSAQPPQGQPSLASQPPLAPRPSLAPSMQPQRATSFMPTPIAAPPPASLQTQSRPGGVPFAPQPPPAATGYNDIPTRSPRIEASGPPLAPQTVQEIIGSLIQHCLARSSPMQRRIVEDSAKRIEALYGQLARGELSPPVMDQVSQMASFIKDSKFDDAHAMHMPLMSGYFSEVGAWILAVKRLLEVARACL